MGEWMSMGGVARRMARVRHRDGIAVRGEELGEPRAELAVPTNDECTLAGAGGLRSQLGLFLRGERSANEQAHEAIGEARRQTQPRALVGRAQQHVAFARVVPRGVAGGALDAGHLAGQALPFRRYFQQLPVQRGKPFTDGRQAPWSTRRRVLFVLCQPFVSAPVVGRRTCI